MGSRCERCTPRCDGDSGRGLGLLTVGLRRGWGHREVLDAADVATVDLGVALGQLLDGMCFQRDDHSRHQHQALIWVLDFDRTAVRQDQYKRLEGTLPQVFKNLVRGHGFTSGCNRTPHPESYS